MTHAAPDAPERYSPRQVHIIFSGLILVMLLGTIDQAIVAPALVPIAAEFGGFGNVSWVVTAYLLTSIASTPLAGRLSDIHGRRSVVVAALGLFLAGTLLCGLAVNLDMLICGRAIQGLGGGAPMALPNTIVADILSPRERGATSSTSRAPMPSPAWPGRCWAGCCRNTIPGAGYSGSNCRSSCWPSYSAGSRWPICPRGGASIASTIRERC